MENTNENNIINFPNNTKNTISKSKKYKKKKNNSHFVILVLIVTLIISLFIYNFLSDSSFDSVDSINGDSISTLTTENYCFADYKDGYIFAKDGKISCFNTNQQLQWEISSSKTAPVVTTNEKYALTYYPKDKLAVVTSGSKTKKITTDGNVVFGSVNKNGYVTLIVDEDGFKSQVAVYDNRGKLKFKWHNSEYHITSAILSDNNKTLLLTEVEMSDDSVKTNVLVTDIRKELEFEKIEFADSVVCSVKFISKDKFIAILDNKTVCFTTRGKERWSTDYSGDNLYTYDISNTNNFALVFGKDDSAHSSSYIYIYNSNGKKIGEYKSDRRIYKIDVQGKTSLISYDRQFEIINSNGKVTSSNDLNIDIHDCIFIGNKKCALVVSGSGASLIEAK